VLYISEYLPAPLVNFWFRKSTMKYEVCMLSWGLESRNYNGIMGTYIDHL